MQNRASRTLGSAARLPNSSSNKVLNDAMRPEAGCALRSCELTVTGAERLMLEEAERIRQEDEDACRAMGEYGLSLLKPGMGILTHCNAGTIATARYGTCLTPIYYQPLGLAASKIRLPASPNGKATVCRTSPWVSQPRKFGCLLRTATRPQ